MAKAALAAVAPINITFVAPHQTLTPVILLLKYPKINKQNKVMMAEYFSPSKEWVTKSKELKELIHLQHKTNQY